MADGIPCAKCGWSETSHKEPTYRGEAEETDCAGFEFSLRSCPGFVPVPVLYELISKEKERRLSWEGAVYTGREQTSMVIWEKMISPLLSGE